MIKAEDIDYSDLQGLVRFAHAQLGEACFLLLDVIDAEAARAWLRGAPVTSAAPVNPLPDQALQVALSASGLRALALDASVINEFSEEFIVGMSADDNRSRRLGDVGSNSPGNWAWGGGMDAVPHVLVMLYARPGGLAAWQEQLQGNHFDSAFKLLARLDSAPLTAEEPFGFVDGISQPDIDWQRTVSTDLHERDRYANLLALGEVVLGYPNEYGLYTGRPLLDPAQVPEAAQLPVAEDQPRLRDLGRNGTYLVFRQLAQDVPGFWQFLDRVADGDAQQREQLAAAMVGRQRDGTPLAELSREPIPGIGNDSLRASLNRFTYDDDPHGLRCPIGAHVRRANPRTGDFPAGVNGLLTRLIRTLGFGQRHAHDDLIASSRFHRILRRGRAYGPPLQPDEALAADAPAHERGLQFVCLGANISRQFEFIQNAWSMSAKFAGLPTESDPLLGNREPLSSGEATDRFTLPQADAPARCINGLPQFVTVRGGAYFFMPGIKALRFIAGHTWTTNKEQAGTHGAADNSSHPG